MIQALKTLMKDSMFYFPKSIKTLPVITLMVFYATLLAQGWTPIGPYGGKGLKQIKFDPNRESRVYVVGPGVMYRSDDTGDSWRNISVGAVPNYQDASLVIAVDNSDEIYYTNNSTHNVFKSLNAGESWELYFSDDQLSIIFINQYNPNHMVAYKRENYNVRTLVKTIDGGNTWQEIMSGVDPTVGSFRVWVNNDMPSVMMMVQWIGDHVITGQNVFRTSDGGEHWEQIYLDDTWVGNIIFDPSNPSTIYLRVQEDLLKTEDGGDTWFEIGNGLPESALGYHLAVIVVDPTDSSILYATGIDEYDRESQPLYTSRDGGLNWELHSKVSPSIVITMIAVDPRNSSILYAGTTPHGVFYSNDGGESWRQKSHGLTIASVYSISAASSDVIFAETENMGIMRTQDGGNTWETVIHNTSTKPGKIIVSASKSQFVFSGALPEYLYYQDTSWAETGGLTISEDGGNGWYFVKAIHHGLYEFDVATDNQTIYGNAILGDIDGLVISGIIKSTDRGETWELLDLGIENVNAVEKIQINPRNEEIVYAFVWLRGAVDDNIVIKSTDGGMTWEIIAEEASNFFLNTTDPNYSYYTARGGNFYISNNEGETWNKLYDIPDSISFADLVVHPASPEVLYASMYSQSVMKSEDHGQSWSPVGVPGQSVGVNNLAISISNSGRAKIFGGTYFEGIRVFQDSAIVNVQPDLLIPDKYILNQPYPNPFNPVTTIQYDLPRAGHVSLTIYDLLGREVEVAIDSWQEAGTHSVVWDATDVPSGMYLVRMKSGSFSQVRKVMVLK